MITAVAIVIPVHDEEALLGDCLRAIEAARAIPVRTSLVVVLDDCSDGSRAVANAALRFGRGTIRTVRYRNVGRARAHGVEVALAQLGAVSLRQTWIATTDADSVVPPTWLSDQIALAEAGVDMMAGVVDVPRWGDYPYAREYEDFYDGSHGHVHGANLGVRATSYLAAGRFAALCTGEDHALWNSVGELGYRCLSTRAISVSTSSRLQGRAPDGFAGFLSDFRNRMDAAAAG